MEDFKGMCRDTLRVKTPNGMWEFARNILLGKGFKSVANEDGFDTINTVPGIIIGKINSAEHAVYFSIEGEFSRIGYTTLDENFSIYHPVLKSIYLGFKINRPIEGVYLYNFKGELIVGFCDGVFQDSNTPKLVNIFNLGIEVDLNYELINPADISKLQYFTESLEGVFNIDYSESGTLDADIIYITYAYVLADGVTTSAFFPVHTIAYPTINYQNKDRRNLILSLTDLDPNYNAIVIGLIINTNNGLVAYNSNNIPYSGTTYNTILSTLANYLEGSLDELLVTTSVYSRIKTMTMHNSELIIGNLVKEDGLKFQKYANLLNLRLWYDVRAENKYTLPILCPDEVYAFYVELQLLNGTWTEAYHIPNNTAPEVGELDDYGDTEFNTRGLNGVNEGVTYKKFHLVNSGRFLDYTIPCDITDEDQMELKWGIFRNEETYPNNDEYDSTVDYNGNMLDLLDLRGEGIRYHRVPGLDRLVQKFPCRLGYTDRNLGSSSTETEFHGLVPAFAVNVDNFDSIVPDEIKNKIQAFRLSVVKRKKGDTLVEDINFLRQSWVVQQNTVDGIKDFEVVMTEKAAANGTDEIKYNVAQFGNSRVYSPTLSILKPNLAPKIIKANYGVTMGFGGAGNGVPYDEFDFTIPGKVGNLGGIFYAPPGHVAYTPQYIKIKEEQKYAKFLNLKYIPDNVEAENTLFIEDFVKLEAKNNLTPVNTVDASNTLDNRWNPLLILNTDDTGNNEEFDTVGWNHLNKTYEAIIIDRVEGNTTNNSFLYGISSTFLNLTKNVYEGFKPKEFITIGRAVLNDTQRKFKEGGDVFTSNTFSGFITQRRGTTIQGGLRYRPNAIKGAIGIYNLSNIFHVKDKDYFVTYLLSGSGNNVAELLLFNYKQDYFAQENLRSLNDLIIDLPFDIEGNFVNYFPYRIHRSLKIGNETLDTGNLRTFLANRYKEMLNDRGEVIAVRGTNKQVFIQQRQSLFVASIKDKLNSNAEETYLGESDLFDRTPEEIMYADTRGYIGCSSQFAAFIFRDGYVVVDQVKGKIFIINNDVDEISKNYMFNWFNENWKTQLPEDGFFTLNRFNRKQNIDNPFTQIGHTVGFDYKYNRLLFTKKQFNFYFEGLLATPFFDFDGEWYYENKTKNINSIRLILPNQPNNNAAFYVQYYSSDFIVIFGYVFMFKTTPLVDGDILIGATKADTFNNIEVALLAKLISDGLIEGEDYIYNSYPNAIPNPYIDLVLLNNDITDIGSFAYPNGVNLNLYVATVPVRIKLNYFDKNYFEEKSKTFSYSLDNKVWVCEHDYYPCFYLDNAKGLYSNLIKEDGTYIFKHNSKTNKYYYYNYLRFNSYVDIIFNSRPDLQKIYQAIDFNTQVIDVTGRTRYFDTIKAVQIYNDNQCSIETILNPNDVMSVRVVENKWQFNDFRDVRAEHTGSPVVDDEGIIDVNTLNNNKSYFDKSNFISTFIVIRVIISYNEEDAVTTYLHLINVKSRMSDR